MAGHFIGINLRLVEALAVALSQPYESGVESDETGSKSFKIWVGDNDSLSLPDVDVYVNDEYVGTTDLSGEVWAVITFGIHTITAEGTCGSASLENEFSDETIGVTVYFPTC